MQRFIEKHLYQRSIISFALLPFAGINYLIQKSRRYFLPQQFKANCKVISVGNIVSGGSGKTPTTIYIAEHLIRKGFKIAVSHRGYKGKFEKSTTIISSREQIFDFAKHAGDEAFLLASKLPNIPVIAGKNRTEAIKLLQRSYPDLDYIILDDSFQHLKVKHDLDFIIFNSLGKIGNGFLLPAGIMREPLSALKYADQIVFNGSGEIPNYLINRGLPITRAKYSVDRFIGSDGEISMEKLKNCTLALMSAIGVPKSFENTVTDCQLTFTKHFKFPDHYNYRDQSALAEIARNSYDYILVTEKDWAKLQFIEHNLPLVVVEVSFEIKELEIK